MGYIGNVNIDENEQVETPSSPQAMSDFLSNEAMSLKPSYLKIRPLKWRLTLRTMLRGGNLMFVGPSGCGKTMAVMEAVKALNRPFFYFNLGSTQDPRTTLVGTREASDGSTYFREAAFVKAIKTPGASILLDELSRAHPEAWNILLTVLDQKQRYLQLDEAADADKVEVAEGVSFLTTANIGNQYTATRTMDRALVDRFDFVEMDVLDEDQEFDLLCELEPDVDREDLRRLARIANETRIEMEESDAPEISRIISTRQSVKMAELLRDGFSLTEVIESVVYPNYSKDGGGDSERAFVQKLVQRQIDDSTSEDLFGAEDMRRSREISGNGNFTF
jgi:MoxR-like ATPase